MSRHKIPTRLHNVRGKLKRTNRSYSVLIADDMDILHEYARLQLKRYPGKIKYQLIHAYHGRDAVELFDMHKPDIIVTDYQMPYLNGHQVLQYVAQSDHACYRIMKTVFDVGQCTLADWLVSTLNWSNNWFKVLDTLPINETIKARKKLSG